MLADFDIAALFEALDEQRRTRDMSWQHVAREINETYREVPCRPISASTLTGIPKRKGLEGNCVLQMLLWLGRTPETCARTSIGDGTRGRPSGRRDGGRCERHPARGTGPARHVSFPGVMRIVGWVG